MESGSKCGWEGSSFRTFPPFRLASESPPENSRLGYFSRPSDFPPWQLEPAQFLRGVCPFGPSSMSLVFPLDPESNFQIVEPLFGLPVVVGTFKQFTCSKPWDSH